MCNVVVSVLFTKRCQFHVVINAHLVNETRKIRYGTVHKIRNAPRGEGVYDRVTVSYDGGGGSADFTQIPKAVLNEKLAVFMIIGGGVERSVT